MTNWVTTEEHALQTNRRWGRTVYPLKQSLVMVLDQALYEGKPTGWFTPSYDAARVKPI